VNGVAGTLAWEISHKQVHIVLTPVPIVAKKKIARTEHFENILGQRDVTTGCPSSQSVRE
jgi:hypothetical protein